MIYILNIYNLYYSIRNHLFKKDYRCRSHVLGRDFAQRRYSANQPTYFEEFMNFQGISWELFRSLPSLSTIFDGIVLWFAFKCQSDQARALLGLLERSNLLAGHLDTQTQTHAPTHTHTRTHLFRLCHIAILRLCLYTKPLSLTELEYNMYLN